MKKIIPAICMSLLGLAAVGTGSYAWFSANAEVSASGLAITATTDSQLAIQKQYIAQESVDTVNQTTVNLNTKCTAALPSALEMGTGVVNVQVPSGYTTAPTPTTSGTPSGYTTIGSVGVVDEITSTDTGHKIEDEYIATSNVTVARFGIEGAKFDLTLEAVINFPDSTADVAPIEKAITIAVIDDTAGSVALKEVSTASAIGSNDLKGKVTYNFGTYSGLSNNTVYHFRFVMFIDGDSEYCTVKNATKLNERTAAFNFSAADAA